MHVKLTATYFLTTDHAKSRFGQPVLVNRATGQAFLPSDAFAPYESWQIMQAAQVVNKMTSWRNFSREEHRLIEQFLGIHNLPEAPATETKGESRGSFSPRLKWLSR